MRIDKQILCASIVCVAITAAGEILAQVRTRESPLVEAARSARKNKGPARISITDADVKRSKGKLIVLPAKPEIVSAEPVPGEPSSLADMEKTADENRARRHAAEADVEKASRDVNDLERELNRVEEDYYLEDDPGYRGEVIESRFETARKQLDQAREKLARARTELQRLEQSARP